MTRTRSRLGFGLALSRGVATLTSRSLGWLQTRFMRGNPVEDARIAP